MCVLSAWKTMTDADKAPYTAKYQEDSKVYEKALSKWEDKMLKEVCNHYATYSV